MAAISGLQSPNPYAQTATKTAARTPSATFGNNLANQAITSHPSYSPDWMQADHVPGAPAANEPAGPGNTVTDKVTFSADFAARYAALTGSDKPPSE